MSCKRKSPRGGLEADDNRQCPLLAQSGHAYKLRSVMSEKCTFYLRQLKIPTTLNIPFFGLAIDW